jgi:phage-related protein
MNKPIQIILLRPAEDFLDSLEPIVRKKFFYSFRKTKERLFGDWFKKMKGTDDIYEFRIVENKKWYRLFAFWDNSNNSQTLIIGSNGYIKKTDKTPQSEIHKAESIKRDYFKNKKL